MRECANAITSVAMGASAYQAVSHRLKDPVLQWAVIELDLGLKRTPKHGITEGQYVSEYAAWPIGQNCQLVPAVFITLNASKINHVGRLSKCISLTKWMMKFRLSNGAPHKGYDHDVD